MAKKLFFGEYLIERGLVTEEDVMEALSYQDKKTPPIETVAIKLSILTMKEVFKIFNLKAGTETSFLDVAFKNNYLSATQIKQINDTRNSLRPPIGQVLLELDKISSGALEEEARKFNAIVTKYTAIRDILMQMPVFSRIGNTAGDYLAYLPERLKFKDNEKVISQGEVADCFYCVISGSLKVTAQNPEKGGKDVYITMIEKNDIFGEAAIFANENRTANVSSVNEVELFRFRRKDFLEFLRKFPGSSQPILIFILQRLLYKLNCTNKELAFERRKFVGQEEVNSLLDELFE